jgi:hypothetical protein
MTWAQLGLRHPLSAAEDGWAWVNPDRAHGAQSSALAAHGTSDFVARTLLQLEKAESATVSDTAQPGGSQHDDSGATVTPKAEEQIQINERTLASLAQRNKQIGSLLSLLSGGIELRSIAHTTSVLQIHPGLLAAWRPFERTQFNG